MEIAKGCEDVSGYAYPVTNKKNMIDLSYAFIGGGGPCESKKTDWQPKWSEDSVENGQTFSYPSTEVHVILGELDSVLIRNRGTDYFSLLHESSNKLHRVEQMGHDLIQSQNGLNMLKGILLQ
jgi:hypothetical protein